ncbi:hypothetical protein QMK33_00285 [Hymenobacter sp. H14-R3]|uniref:hypothetical protein n=1 Tax=Hymenobacter sp. H14-R3 TaxID=3046308 RepID=UPI0024BBB4C7|nr:hypothetical protein [Hymenobacter sp. H14-R3]MDJ0363571.1 hypothetical protein [Hymenobacter sp. H14-R3]
MATAENNNPTAEQITQWTEEHGKLKTVEVDGLQIVFKQPSRDLVAQATDAMVRAKGSVSKYNNIILKNCQLSHIQETKADDEIYFALCQVVDSIVSSKVAALKND